MAQLARDRHFSDLQLIENDSTARGLEPFIHDLPGNAPQLDHERWAPELDHSLWALEPDHEQWVPQVATGINSPARVTSETLENISLNVKDPQRYSFAISKKLCWVSSACTISAAVAVAVGVGIGVGLNKNIKDTFLMSDPAITISTELKADHDTSPSVEEHGMTENSSFAIVSTSDDNKHLFFQELSGNIRQAFYNTSESSWETSANLVIASNAKNNTPISAFSYLVTDQNKTYDAVLLAYINKTNEVDTMMMVYYSSNGWFKNTFTINGHSLQASPDSKFLSIGRIFSSIGDVSVDTYLTNFLLFLESPGGGISVYEASNISAELRHITAELYASLPTIDLETPFTSCEVTGNGNNVALSAVFTAKNGSVLVATIYNAIGTFSSIEISVLAVPGSPVTGSGDLPSALDPNSESHVNVTAVRDSDLIITGFEPISKADSYFPSSGFWINGTTLEGFGYGVLEEHDAPPGPFPYSRLTTYIAPNSSTINIYHQLSATVIAEAVYQDAIGGWESNNITILTS